LDHRGVVATHFRDDFGAAIAGGQLHQLFHDGGPLAAQDRILLAGEDLLQGRHHAQILQISAVCIEHPIDVIFVHIGEMRHHHFARRGEFRSRHFVPLRQPYENCLGRCNQRGARPLRQRRRNLFQIAGFHLPLAQRSRGTACTGIQARPERHRRSQQSGCGPKILRGILQCFFQLRHDERPVAGDPQALGDIHGEGIKTLLMQIQ
jgi:hypothetical protein